MTTDIASFKKVNRSFEYKENLNSERMFGTALIKYNATFFWSEQWAIWAKDDSTLWQHSFRPDYKSVRPQHASNVPDCLTCLQKACCHSLLLAASQWWNWGNGDNSQWSTSKGTVVVLWRLTLLLKHAEAFGQSDSQTLSNERFSQWTHSLSRTK